MRYLLLCTLLSITTNLYCVRTKNQPIHTSTSQNSTQEMLKIQDFHHILQQSNLLLEEILAENAMLSKKFSDNNRELLHTLQLINTHTFSKVNHNPKKANKEIFTHLDFTQDIIQLLEKYHNEGKVTMCHIEQAHELFEALITLNNYHTPNPHFHSSRYARL